MVIRENKMLSFMPALIRILSMKEGLKMLNFVLSLYNAATKIICTNSKIVGSELRNAKRVQQESSYSESLTS
jgi:hypothetical protein